jgi:hypothetical protein
MIEAGKRQWLVAVIISFDRNGHHLVCTASDGIPSTTLDQSVHDFICRQLSELLRLVWITQRLKSPSMRLALSSNIGGSHQKSSSTPETLSMLPLLPSFGGPLRLMRQVDDTFRPQDAVMLRLLGLRLDYYLGWLFTGCCLLERSGRADIDQVICREDCPALRTFSFSRRS